MTRQEKIALVAIIIGLMATSFGAGKGFPSLASPGCDSQAKPGCLTYSDSH